MIAQSFPPELEQFVEEQLAAGNYQSQQDLLVSAVRVLRDVQIRRRQFLEDVRIGVEQLERSEYTEYDDAGLCHLFEELEQVAKNRAEAAGGGK
jgi:Arc/MetJ-type ribon-helix-helix transcriptional regulator